MNELMLSRLLLLLLSLGIQKSGCQFAKNDCDSPIGVHMLLDTMSDAALFRIDQVPPIEISNASVETSICHKIVSCEEVAELKTNFNH